LDCDEPVSSHENRPITEDEIVAQQVTSSVIKAMTRVLTEPPPQDKTSALERRKSRLDECCVLPRSLLDW
jgi:hypothetical protein